MDLIYADENMVDIGVLDNYNFDLAYGNLENDFELTMSISNNVVNQDNYIYIEHTEYGGIVDSIAPSTDSSTITYSGRTWTGILDSYVVYPSVGNDYIELNNDVSMCVVSLLDMANVGRFFVVDFGDFTQDIVYRIRYNTLYGAIIEMLQSIKCKLKFDFYDGQVHLVVKRIKDYSIDEEFDSSQLSLSIKKNYNVCNHLMCLGQGDLHDRKVIHLFTDENGGIQPFSTVDEPIKDSQYILGKENQILKGKDEIAQIFDYPNAQIKQNYEVLLSQPEDWDNTYQNYYDSSFEKIPLNLKDVYEVQIAKPSDWDYNGTSYYTYNATNNRFDTVEVTTTYKQLTTKPSDWDENYANYYKLVSGNYENYEKVQTTFYTKQAVKPIDWDINYNNYYNYWSDGVTWEYRPVSSASQTVYKLQTRQPSDWATNWKNYYVLYLTGDYTTLGNLAVYTRKKTAPKWRKNSFFTEISISVPPNWALERRYTINIMSGSPTFTSGNVYRKDEETIPTWEDETYYTLKENVNLGIYFQPKMYYTIVEDSYSELVNAGINKLTELYSQDKVNLKIDINNIYDVGDIIGAVENITGIEVYQPITKKIVNISKGIEKIEYEVNGNGG